MSCCATILKSVNVRINLQLLNLVYYGDQAPSILLLAQQLMMVHCLGLEVSGRVKAVRISFDNISCKYKLGNLERCRKLGVIREREYSCHHMVSQNSKTKELLHLKSFFTCKRLLLVNIDQQRVFLKH